MLRLVVLLLGLLTLTGTPVLSATFYVAPLGTQSAGTPDGSENLPFLSIDAALASGKVKGGDTLLLKDGAYGAVTIKANAAFDTPVTIMSQNAKAAHFDSILLAGTTRNLILRNLSVWPRNPAMGALSLIRSYSTTSGITLDGLDVRSEEQAGQFMQWDAAKWESRKFSGVFLQGRGSVVTGSVLTGIYDGISVGVESLIANNKINGYNGDGIRAVSYGVVRNNTVTNCVKTDANHDDGFQAYSSDSAAMTGLILDSNVFIEWNGDSTHPLRCTLQGIGMFDGPYDDLTITNNIIAVSGYHGISVYGPRGGVIANNTVVHSMGHTVIYPYIAIRADKDGTIPTNMRIANNVAMSFQGVASPENNVIFLNNSVIGAPSLVFENSTAFNYRPRASSGFIDSGDIASAPAKDITGQPRPSGAGPDRGAFEMQASTGTMEPTPIVESTPIVAPAPEPTTTPISPGPKRVKPVKSETVTGSPKRIMRRN